MKLDALVLAAHPDDAEISLGGTILRMVDGGARVGVLDLTRGEMGTRGTRDDRDRETARANELLGLAFRENLGLPDGRVTDDVESRERVADVIRRTQPRFQGCDRTGRDATAAATASRDFDQFAPKTPSLPFLMTP